MERIIAENWSVLVSAPVAFIAALCLGAATTWILVGLIYNQRLTHYQELLANYRDALEEKFPVKALRSFPSKRSKKMFLGLLLIFGGAVAVVIGGLIVWLDRSPSPPKVANFDRAQPISPAVAPAAIGVTGSTPDGPRQLLDKTPRELLAIYEGRTPFQADPIIQLYKGKWIKAQGKIINLLPDGVPGHSIAVLEDGSVIIECRLDQRWMDKIVKLNKGDILNVLGQIGPSQNGSQLYLVSCELT